MRIVLDRLSVLRVLKMRVLTVQRVLRVLVLKVLVLQSAHAASPFVPLLGNSATAPQHAPERSTPGSNSINRARANSCGGDRDHGAPPRRSRGCQRGLSHKRQHDYT